MMKIKTIHLIILFGVVVILGLLFGSRVRIPLEAFTQPNCPTSAERTSDGTIKVMPGNKIFKTMPEYVDYLKGIYNDPASAGCVPPIVKPFREPQDGVIGGLGSGTISPKQVAAEGPDQTVLDTRSSEYETPSAQTSIDKLDDYEYSRVFQLERTSRNTPLQKETKDKLLSQRILDWANLPFNSEDRASAEKEFIAGRMEDIHQEPKSGVFFKNMESTDTVFPPDEEALKMREKAILAAYRPTEPGKHVIDNETEQVAKLVHDVYANDPNWEPVVEKTGPNSWAVKELRPKARKEQWASETPSVTEARSQGLITPQADIQIYDRQMDDPYFDKRGVVDVDNDKFWNYREFNKWTPGLERMFAPTNDVKEWY